MEKGLLLFERRFHVVFWQGSKDDCLIGACIMREWLPYSCMASKKKCCQYISGRGSELEESIVPW